MDHPEEAGPLWYNYPFSQERLQADMDQEIRYAHGAGIDFFIYHGFRRLGTAIDSAMRQHAVPLAQGLG